MKTNDHNTMRCLLRLMMAAAGLLFIACTDTDVPGDQKERVQLEVVPYVPSFTEVSPIQTRAFPEDYKTGDNQSYVTYDDLYENFEPQQSLVEANIHMFFTQQGEEEPEQGYFRKTGDKWISLVEMESGQYYLYGFIPENVVGGATNISPITGGYEKGAVISLTKLSSVVPADVCVTVAAGGGTVGGPNSGYGIGKFGFLGTDKYIYLLFDHLYASLCFQFKVDAEYNKLRTIKIKQLRLKSEYMKKYYDATITLTGKTDGSSPITSISFSGSSYSDDADGLLFKAAGATTEVTLKDDAYSEFLGCFVPGDYNRFTLETTYDVYDKKDNLIRKDCVAENFIYTNSFLTTGQSWRRGTMLKLSLTVIPTYLYMLSEPDLDNPTATLQ